MSAVTFLQTLIPFGQQLRRFIPLLISHHLQCGVEIHSILEDRAFFGRRHVRKRRVCSHQRLEPGGQANGITDQQRANPAFEFQRDSIAVCKLQSLVDRYQSFVESALHRFQPCQFCRRQPSPVASIRPAAFLFHHEAALMSGDIRIVGRQVHVTGVFAETTHAARLPGASTNLNAVGNAGMHAFGVIPFQLARRFGQVFVRTGTHGVNKVLILVSRKVRLNLPQLFFIFQ